MNRFSLTRLLSRLQDRSRVGSSIASIAAAGPPLVLLLVTLAEAQSSTSYTVEVAAGVGGSYSSIAPETSINSDSTIAFVATSACPNDPGKSCQNVYTANPGAAPLGLLNPSWLVPDAGDAPTQTFGPGLEINDNGIVVTRRRLNAVVLVGLSILTQPLTYLEAWNGAISQDEAFQLAMGDGFGGDPLWLFPFFLNPAWAGIRPSPYDTNTQFSAIFDRASINNDEDVVFSVLARGSQNQLATVSSVGKLVVDLSVELPRLRMADNETFVARLQGSSPSSGRIVVLPPQFFPFVGTVADASRGFSSVGAAPTISATGEVVAFVGNRGLGEQLFLSFRETATFSDPIAIAGLGDFSEELGGRVADASTRYFARIEPDSPLGVVHLPGGPPGIEGDEVVVTFLAAPNQIGSNLPANLGLWTVRTLFRPRVDMPTAIEAIPKVRPLSVIQVGDVLGVEQINSVALHDPVAFDATSSTREWGLPRDHTVALSAETSFGTKVLRAKPANAFDPKVFIDPGHGRTPGSCTCLDPYALINQACGPQRERSANLAILEDELTLGVALHARQHLGTRPLLSRQDCFSYAIPGCIKNGGCAADLQERVRIAQRKGARVFVSIHTNGSDTDATANGTEVFWSRFNAAPSDSMQLAQGIHDRLQDLGLRPRGVKDAGSAYFVTHAFRGPAALVEVAFHSNTMLALNRTMTDEELLASPSFLDLAGKALAHGITDFCAGSVHAPANRCS